MKKYFVTGTDTEVGKTFVTSALLKLMSDEGKKCVGLKPIASGCEKVDGCWVNEDALSLIKNSSLKLPYEQINPIAFPEAIAPHLAAIKNGIDLTSKNITDFCHKTFNDYENLVDCILVEGAGGWFVPLNNKETYADVVKPLNLDIILVVGIRLGCINHALLTESAIQQSGLSLAGWVANGIDPKTSEQPDIVATLTSRINAPCLGVIPFIPDQNNIEGTSSASSYLNSFMTLIDQ